MRVYVLIISPMKANCRTDLLILHLTAVIIYVNSNNSVTSQPLSYFHCQVRIHCSALISQTPFISILQLVRKTKTHARKKRQKIRNTYKTVIFFFLLLAKGEGKVNNYELNKCKRSPN